MPKFNFTNDFCDRVETIVGKKFTRGGQKMMADCLDILETRIKEIEK